jgi:hypothetical protein
LKCIPTKPEAAEGRHTHPATANGIDAAFRYLLADLAQIIMHRNMYALCIMSDSPLVAPAQKPHWTVYIAVMAADSKIA